MVVFKGVTDSPHPRNVGKNFSHCKNYAPKYLAARAWPEAFWNVRKSHLVSIKCKKTLGGGVSAPNPAAWGAYSAPRPTIAGGSGASCPFSENPPQLSTFQISLWPFRPRLSPPYNFDLGRMKCLRCWNAAKTADFYCQCRWKGLTGS